MENKGINMKQLIIDKRMRILEKEKLEELGYNLVEIQKSLEVYEEISSHVDIFVCKIGNKIIIEPNQYELIHKIIYEKFKIEKGQEKIGHNYPSDIKYNVCTIGKKALHNFEFCDSKLKQELINQGYELVNTTQGYTNCSIAVIDENSAIVTDKGLYKILQKHNIDVLYLPYEPNIKLLNGQEYSKRKGFIGGAISRVGNKIIIFGDLKKIDKEGIIREFISKKSLEILEFEGLDVVDYGGIVEINE